jgi:hypothetical protein
VTAAATTEVEDALTGPDLEPIEVDGEH